MLKMNTFLELSETNPTKEQLKKNAAQYHDTYPEASHGFAHLTTFDLMDEADRDHMRLAANRKASAGPIRNLKEIFRNG